MDTIHLLVIGDNPDDFYLLKEVLDLSQTIRCNIFYSTKLGQALETVQTENIDLAILDLNLPDSFGLDTLLRFAQAAPLVPVVNDGGRTVNFIAVKEDITDKKALEKLKEDVNHIMRHDLKGPSPVSSTFPNSWNLKGN